MKRLETRLEGPILLAPTLHGDHRGFFLETYRRDAYAELGIATLCRTGLMVDSIDHYLGFPSSGLPGMLAPTGHHGAHHDVGRRPATNAAGTLSAVGASSSPAAGGPPSTEPASDTPVPNAGPSTSQEA